MTERMFFPAVFGFRAKTRRREEFFNFTHGLSRHPELVSGSMPRHLRKVEGLKHMFKIDAWMLKQVQHDDYTNIIADAPILRIFAASREQNTGLGL